MNIDFSNRDLYNYNFIPLLHSTKRYIFLKWGGGSGKSVFASQKEIIKSYETKDRIMCVRKVKDTLKDSMFSELKKRISEWSLDDHFEITKSPMLIKNKLSWCEFIFRWLDDPEKLKSVADVSRVRIEEATEINKEWFDQIDLRLRGKKNMQITCSFNPVDAESRLNTDFRSKWESADIDLHHSTYTDNRFVGEEYRNVMNRLLDQNQNYYNIYALGQRWILDGLVFDKRDIIQSVPNWAELLWYGQDFGYTNDPSSLIALYKHNNELVFDEIFYLTGLTNVYREEKDKEKSIVWQYQINNIEKNIDIFGDSSEPKSIEEIAREWYGIKSVVKWPDSIMHGIDTMKSYKINVTARSGNLQKEFRKYCRAKDKSWKLENKPIDAFNHGIDASRYISMMKLGKKRLIGVWKV